MYQGYFFRKIPGINASFPPKYAHVASKFWARCKDFPTKCWNTIQEQTQFNKKRFVFEQSRQTNQRMMNVRKKQFKSFWNFRGRDIISDYEFLLSILNAFTVGTEEYYPRCNNVNDAKGLQILYQYCNITLHLDRGCKSKILANLTGAF